MDGEHRRGFFSVPATVAKTLRWGARIWTSAVLVVLGILSLTRSFPRDLDSDGMLGTMERPVQLGLLAVALAALLLAWRLDAVVAVALLLAGSGFGALSWSLHPPVVGVLVTGSFLLPAAAFWVLWQRGRARRSSLNLALATAGALALGVAGTAVLYGQMFGPTHPESAAPELPVDRVEWVWSGAVTETSFRVNARIGDGAVEHATLVVAEDGSRAAAPQHDIGPVAIPGGDVVTWTVTGLQPDTSYEYTVVVDGHVDSSRGMGTARTFPDGPASFTVAIGACARTGSVGAVFDAIREKEPLLYINDGDLHYGNVDTDDVDMFRARYGDVLTSAAQSALYRSTPTAYVWDDHDYGANSAVADSASRDAARFAYRENVPHYPLPAGETDAAIYQAFTAGRVRFILTDVRSEQTDDSLLGERQLRWLEDELATASRDHALVVWVNPVPWIASSAGDHWGGFPEERRLIAEHIEDEGIENLVMLSGDAHMLAIDDGSNSGYGPSGEGFPVLHAAALDRPGSSKGGPYSHGAAPGGGQFGTITVHDDGSGPVTVDLAGWDWTGDELLSYTFTVP
ncbi:alkaline phosphatase D family protein [Phytoactinopolyspora endophytica]|uniref:alkaline phosphatase D family protein n=1 Tax=Phytoactinopolyspora endophytica TaxID=1642495 RepID=UPI00101DE6F9|nr:alkaline phosphatase D family protein [Phytoactinopolyspora endophytica]